MSRVVGVALLAWTLAACGGERDSEERQSAARVLRAEQVVRDAANSEKARVLDALSAARCSADSCEVQRRCHAAYALHVEALGLTAAAKQQLADGDGAQAAKLLGSAELKLHDAGAKVADCTERAAALRRKYKL